MSEEDEVTSGAQDDDVWTVEFDPEPDEFDEPKPDDFDWGPSSEGAGKGRLLIGLGLLLVGIIIALVAWSQSGDDGGDNASKSTTTTAAKGAKATTTTEAATVTIVPTTIAGGALPTGCGDWDPAFSFDPDPIEGVTIYSDFEGWHVVLAPDGPPVVTGTVVGQVTPFVSTEEPPGPGVQLIADPNTATVTFRLTAGDENVGFDFAADCAQKALTFDLKDEGGQPLDPAVVHLGRKGGTPSLPVVAQRTMAAS